MFLRVLSLSDAGDLITLPGHYDEDARLRVNGDGSAVVQTAAQSTLATGTKGGRDPGDALMSTVTKIYAPDRDDEVTPWLWTRTGAEPDRDPDHLSAMSTHTRGGADRD